MALQKQHRRSAHFRRGARGRKRAARGIEGIRGGRCIRGGWRRGEGGPHLQLIELGMVNSSCSSAVRHPCGKHRTEARQHVATQQALTGKEVCSRLIAMA